MTSDQSAQVRPERGFVLDDFQIDAMQSISEGRSVVVAAPTGSGKTVLAEHAIEIALADGERAFYTSPIKALANQKFRSFQRRYGQDQVGLLTGDNSINGQAPIVVMTTEVLRNMIYEAPHELHSLGWVVLDEVHYLQDRFRGPVWEEVILHLDRSVRIVGLSATVSNLDELTDWLGLVRGPTDLVVSHVRPVPLHQQLAVAKGRRGPITVLPLLVNGKPNPKGADLDVAPGDRYRRQRKPGGNATPRRAAVATMLHDQDLSPAIYFVFSRAGCDDGVRQCADAGLAFTNAAERAQIEAILERHLSRIDHADRASLQIDAWEDAVKNGVASHHAGLVPACKEAIEEAFAAGLITIVFATETLALGINMPARSTVLESLTKFNGETHELLTPLEYTQLSGRAGRRGIDPEGNAITLWSPRLEFETVSTLATSTRFPLRSAFRPNYNMTANLIRRFDRDGAHEVVGRSFAQFQTDRTAVAAANDVHRLRERAQEAAVRATCERGDVVAYRENLASGGNDDGDHPDDIAEALRSLRPGDIISEPGIGQVVVLSSTERKRGPKVRAVHASGGVAQYSTEDLTHVPERLELVELPQPYRPKSPEFHREVAALLKGRSPKADTGPAGVGGCPDLAAHLKALDQSAELRRRARSAERRIARRGGALTTQLDDMAELLDALGYAHGWRLTDEGHRLAAIHHEADLILAEGLGAGVFDDLSAEDLCAVASCISYEPRRKEEAVARMPTKASTAAAKKLTAITLAVHRAEKDILGADRSPSIERGFAGKAFRWASGRPLGEVIDDPDEAGEFVRNIKQLTDLLSQLSDLAPTQRLADTAADAAELIDRGVVRSATSAARGRATPAQTTDDDADS